MSFPNLSATDLDQDKLTFSYGPPLDSKGKWQTKRGDAGAYIVDIKVSDGKVTTMQKVQIVVEPYNKPPVISPIKAITVNEGQTIALEPKVTDPEGDPLSISFTGWKTSFPYKTSFDDSGDHLVMITANDGTANTSINVPITVRNVNRVPSIKVLPDVTLSEGDRVTVKPTISDPDNDPLTVYYSKPLSTEGRWETAEGSAGVYPVKATVSDGSLSASAAFTITVKKKNLPPEINGVKDITAKEGETIALNIYATDPENQSVTIRYSGFMSEPSKEIGFEDQGSHQVTVTATDGANTVSDTFTVTVIDINRAPVFNPDAFK